MCDPRAVSDIVSDNQYSCKTLAAVRVDRVRHTQFFSLIEYQATHRKIRQVNFHVPKKNIALNWYPIFASAPQRVLTPTFFISFLCLQFSKTYTAERPLRSKFEKDNPHS